MNKSLVSAIALLVFSTWSLAQKSEGTQGTANSSSQSSKTIALTGGKLLTITHGVMENGVLVISGGKISAVGSAESVKIPPQAQVIDVKGMTVYPGLIDSETHLGLVEIEADKYSTDLVETSSEIMPHMHVYDAFHAESERIPVSRINGITNAIVAPDSQDTLPGQDIFIQLAGRNRDEMILKRDIALPLNFGADQRRRDGGFGSWHFPSTRMGLATELRQTFLDTQHYMAEAEAAQKKNDKNFKRDLKFEALIPYLKGERPVVLGAYESHDVETAMELAREFHLKVVLNHVTHAQDIMDEIAAYKVPVVFGSIYDFPQANERYDAVYSMPAELVKRGVKLAFSSSDAQFYRNLPYEAGYAVAYGLPYDEALKAITLNPAEIWGVADQLGSLDVGKMANIVVANGDPLDVRTSVKHVYIQGNPISMESRQTKLRDEYSK